MVQSCFHVLATLSKMAGPFTSKTLKIESRFEDSLETSLRALLRVLTAVGIRFVRALRTSVSFSQAPESMSCTASTGLCSWSANNGSAATWSRQRDEVWRGCSSWRPCACSLAPLPWSARSAAAWSCCGNFWSASARAPVPSVSASSTSCSSRSPVLPASAAWVRFAKVSPRVWPSCSPMTLAASGLSTIPVNACCKGGVRAAPRGVAMRSAIIAPSWSPAWCAALWMAASSWGAEALMSLTIFPSTTLITSLMPSLAKSSMVFSSWAMPAGVAYFIIMSTKPWVCDTMPWIWMPNESRLLLDSEE
mmetsp:Transcript_9052/g.24246  ORF Transcript_9052/g.24246 Transcript_9052/m.24246 type:complete len:306 (+) Transcript_9052:759-1676(+)